MTHRVFVRVVGFADVERHALNTVFRLSEQGSVTYSLWEPGAPDAARLVLVDGQSPEAEAERDAAGDDPELKLIWVGAISPASAWRTFQRPITWSEVVLAMDELFLPGAPVDFDLDLDALETGPGLLVAGATTRRALIASADRDERLYMRAKLSLAQLTRADEAESAAQLRECLRAQTYAVALVDFSLPDADGWALLKELREMKDRVAKIVVTKSPVAVADRARAWFLGADGFFEKPPHPGKLHSLLVSA